MQNLFRRIWSRRSLIARLMIIHGLILVAVMAIVPVVLLPVLNRGFQQSLDNTVHEEVLEYSESAQREEQANGLAAFTTQYFRYNLLGSHRVLAVRLANGTVLESARAGTLVKTPDATALLRHPPAGTTISEISTGEESYRIVATWLTLGRQSVFLIAGANTEVLREQASAALEVMIAADAIAILVALASTYLALRAALVTVGRVTDTALAIGQHDVSQRVGFRGDDEVGHLAHTFDEMLDRLDQAFQERRQLLSDVSHQLRTPLTVIRGHLEVLQRGGYEERNEVSDTVALVLDELIHVIHLVDRFMMLGRSLEPDFLELEDVDLRSMIVDLYAAAQSLAPRRWMLGPAPSVVVRIDRDKLRGALFNLIDNAVKATGPEDFIRLEAHSNAELILAVADSGRGIPTDQQEAVFKRFVHGVGDRRSGSGLGLAIVKAVAEAHGGHVRLESAPGTGSVVCIVLPGECIQHSNPQSEV